MATIPNTFIQDLVARVDVVDIVGRYVTLKKAGATFKGLCPFHGEKTPSFVVSPVRQTYHCFGCGAHGDAIGFLMEYNGLSFVEAVKDLAQQVGVQVPQEHVSPEEQVKAQKRKEAKVKVTDLLAKAQEHWQVALKQDAKASAYVQHRGLTEETLSRFGIGYAPAGWQGLAQAFTDYEENPLLLESGLVIESEPDPSRGENHKRRYDRFRDRLMFPIRSVKGEVIGFGGRVLGQGEPKYLNSPETSVFSKGHELYGLFEARSAVRTHNHLLVTEGYMDVVTLAQHGFASTVATLGTACTPEHLQKMFRFTEQVIFSFDGDQAGKRAARRALEVALPFATDIRTIKFLFLPPEHDPDSYIQAHGAEQFKQLIAHATPLSQFFLEVVRSGCDLSTPEGRARMAAQAYPLWNQFPSSGVLSMQMLSEVAQMGQMTTDHLAGLWQQKSSTEYPTAEAMPSDRSQPPVAWQRDTEGGYRTSSYEKKSNWSGRGKGWKKPVQQPPMRSDQAPLKAVESCMVILATHSQWWEHLSGSDQELLCAQPGWHSVFFKWLERLVMNHGEMNWPALREVAQQEPWYDLLMVLTNDIRFNVALESGIKPEELEFYLGLVRNEKTRADSLRILEQFKHR